LITLIAGPPCAGKTTLARRLAEPGHVVLDFDDVAVRLGSPSRWRHPQAIITAANAVIMRELLALRDADDHPPAWVIRCAPRAAVRERMAAGLGARVWLLDPGVDECLARARQRPAGTAHEIRKWYRLYAPSDVDEAPPDLRVDDRGAARDHRGSP
jgi:hypothetical protein